MHSLTIKISPAAQQDLHKIYQHSASNWGEVQANKYLTAIQLHFSLLLEQPFLGRDRPNLFQKTRSLAVNKHIVFYKIQDKHIIIARILHERQDPERHLS